MSTKSGLGDDAHSEGKATNKKTAKNTKHQILETAEKEFADNGFAGTTLRNLVKKAGVNLAAVGYHFGSKEELFRTVVAGIAQPIVYHELEAVDRLEQQAKERGEPLTLEQVLTAFLQPSLQYLMQEEQQWMVKARLMGRCRTETAPIQSLAANEFSESFTRFLGLMEQAVPDQSRSELHWKLDLVITILLRVLTEVGQPNALLQTNSTEAIEEAVAKLVKLLAAGIRA